MLATFGVHTMRMSRTLKSILSWPVQYTSSQQDFPSYHVDQFCQRFLHPYQALLCQDDLFTTFWSSFQWRPFVGWTLLILPFALLFKPLCHDCYCCVQYLQKYWRVGQLSPAWARISFCLAVTMTLLLTSWQSCFVNNFRRPISPRLETYGPRRNCHTLVLLTRLKESWYSKAP